MAVPQPCSGEVKARILCGCEKAPVQLVLSPEVAIGLAFVAGDFASEIVPNCDEAKYLIALSELVSNSLLDVLAVHASAVLEPQALAG